MKKKYYNKSTKIKSKSKLKYLEKNLPNHVQMVVQKTAKKNEYLGIGIITSKKELAFNDFEKNLLILNFRESLDFSFKFEYRNTKINKESITESIDTLSLTELSLCDIWQHYYSIHDDYDNVVDIVTLKTLDSKTDNNFRYIFTTVFKQHKNILNDNDCMMFSSEHSENSFSKLMKPVEDFDGQSFSLKHISEILKEPHWVSENGNYYSVPTDLPLLEIKKLNFFNNKIVRNKSYQGIEDNRFIHPNPYYLDFLIKLYEDDPCNLIINKLHSKNEFHKIEDVSMLIANNTLGNK